MERGVLILISVIAIVLIGGYFTFQALDKNIDNFKEYKAVETKTIFENPKKTPHWEYNVPEHESVIAAVPINVVLGFNFDLGHGTSISITKDNVEYGIGDTKIEDNKLIMRRYMDPSSPNGVYKVDYNACWPDGSCHAGFFQFEINRNHDASFTNLEDNQEITINLKDITFDQDKIIISGGTKIIWINMDPVVHYINSDPHPGHSYFPEQNSGALEKGDSFSLVFDKPGIYPYHCSVHTNMKGTIIVK